MVEVESPKTIGDVVSTMTGIANISYNGMGNEYGMMLYADEDGKPRMMVQRGGWFITQVRPYPFIKAPDGKKMMLIGVIAHNHPFGDSIPSGGDMQCISDYDKLFGQKYSILVVPGGRWCLFDGNNMYDPFASSSKLLELLKLPIDALFGRKI